jgi:hypothetical protein
MTVSELISKLSFYPPETRVTLLDPDTRWLLPIEIKDLPAQGSNREVDFIAITADTRTMKSNVWRMMIRRPRFHYT